MRRDTKPDLFRVNNQTMCNHEILAEYKNALEDTFQKERLLDCECQVCWCRSVMAGQSFTEYNCTICEKQNSWHNTNAPSLCQDCAKKYKICRRCYATLNNKFKRSLNI